MKCWPRGAFHLCSLAVHFISPSQTAMTSGFNRGLDLGYCAYRQKGSRGSTQQTALFTARGLAHETSELSKITQSASYLLNLKFNALTRRALFK